MQVLSGFLKRNRVILIIWAGVLTVSFLLPFLIPLPEGLYPPVSKIVRDRNGRVLRVYISRDEKWRIFVPIEKIDPLLIKSTIAYEDRFYYHHPGFNPFALFRALLQNIRAGEIVSGGSTIAMQLARIVEPKPRTVKSKVIEILRAYQFTVRLGKKGVLERYLNLAPYGGNVEGVGAASLAYFEKLPDSLLPGEVAFLVSLPQSPSLRRPGRRDRQDARDRVLKRMLKFGLINEEEYRKGLSLSIPDGFKPFPVKAPHACDFLILKYPEKNDIKSTIDIDIQMKAENILQSYRKYIETRGATNASVVVIENETGKVRAAVGSMDYFDKTIDGQVRGFYSFRSPGSALKPFLYALALEEGVITTEMLIEDAPYSFSGFSPKDYSGKWLGLVKAEDALSYSLNMPFVLILRRAGYRRFMEKLYAGGVRGPLPMDDYGLPVITGGMEVRLLELANLYACFARGGRYFEWRMLEDEPIPPDTMLFRPGAVYLTLKAISKRNRPDAPDMANFVFPRSVVYWKTGTSWGRRDAWCFGFQKNYTVGVWVGNFSGQGAQDIVGAKLAAPILFDILRSVEPEYWDGTFDWEEDALKELELVDVCAFSGYRPGPNCIEEKEVFVLKGANPFKRCPFHRKFILEKKTGYRACPWKHYREGETEEAVLIVLPGPVRNVMGKGGIPSFPPDCNLSAEKKTLRIASPDNGSVHFTPAVRDAGYLFLQAYSSVGKGIIHWFVNGVYLGDSESGEILSLRPEEGELRIVAQDDEGSTEEVHVKVVSPHL